MVSEDEIEVIPIDRELAQNKQPMFLEVTDLDAWPNERFQFQFDWNSVMERWVIEFRHVDTDTKFAHSPACLMRQYSFDPYVHFIFMDKSNEATEVTPENLGQSVKLTVWPGSEGVTP